MGGDRARYAYSGRMAEITFKVARRVHGWKVGQVLTVERTDYTDMLLAKGHVEEVEFPSVAEIETADRPVLYPGQGFPGEDPEERLDRNPEAKARVETALANQDEAVTRDLDTTEGEDDGSSGEGEGVDEHAADPDGSAETGEDPGKSNRKGRRSPR